MQNTFLLAFLILHFSPNIIETGTGTENGELTTLVSNGILLEEVKYPALELNNKFYCPAENLNCRTILQDFTRNENILKTLFRKFFHPNAEKTCLYEVEPELTTELDEKGNQVNWRKNKYHNMYLFDFQFWGEDKSVDQHYESVRNRYLRPMPVVKLDFSTIYTICHDTSINRVIWSKYEILKFQNIDNRYIHVSNEISIKPFCFKKDYFSNIDQAFKIYNGNQNNYKMIKQKLIPDEHMSPIQRSATNHYANVAALWDGLEKLMKAINDGTRKINYKIKSEPAKVGADGEIIPHEFTIYTKLFYSKAPTSRTAVLGIPYIWCKLLHYQNAKEGLLIYVHNTPEEVPREEDMKCLKGKREDCNFGNWIDDDEDVINQEYAYCCNPVDSEVVKYFGLESEIEAVLKL